MIKQQGKVAYLTTMWDKELNSMIAEAFKDKSKKGKDLVKQLTGIDDDLAKKMIKVYIERCKFKYCLAFLQWRNSSYHAKSEDLIEIFQARLNILISTIRKGGSNKGKFKH
jgi:hypothetical protein